MSLAKINQVGRVRKVTECEKCGDKIWIGQPAVKFAVGFRGRTQVRCSKPECFPKPSERESSLVSGAYAAQEDADVSGAGSLEELQQVRDGVAEAVREVAREYEDSEMFDRNEDLQERAETLGNAADELDNWEPDGEEPTEDDRNTWEHENTEYATFDEAHDAWLEAARASLETAINEMELP